MVRFSTVLVVFALVLAVAGFVQVPTSYAVWHHDYWGRVISYDPGTNTLVVSGKKGEKAFDVSKAMTNGALEPNETVKVTYYKAHGMTVANSVRVMGPESH